MTAKNDSKKALELLNDVEFPEKYQGVQEYTEMLIVCPICRNWLFISR